MPVAYLTIRADPVYRREAFAAGLRAAGYDVRAHPGGATINRGDILVQWNRYGEGHDLATRFESAGCQAIIAENGFLGVDRADRRIYALADGHHQAGFWHVGDDDRFGRLSIPLEPWRTSGRHILIAPNREFGMPGMIQPNMFAEHMARQLMKITDRPIKIRPHPGNNPPKIPFADDLRDCWAVVIWSSSAGVQALVAGVPVFCIAPYWVARGATFQNLKLIDNPPLDTIDRAKSFHALAWAQWHLWEIEQGIPFKHLTGKPLQHAPA